MTTPEETPGEGHNSSPSGVAGDRLKSFIERVEHLTEEKETLAQDIREVFAEAKSTGFDVKTMRVIIRLRKIDRQARQEQEHLIELYKQAVGLD